MYIKNVKDTLNEPEFEAKKASVIISAKFWWWRRPWRAISRTIVAAKRTPATLGRSLQLYQCIGYVNVTAFCTQIPNVRHH